MGPAGVNSRPTQQTTLYSTVETWEPCQVAERPTEMSFEAVSYCDHAQLGNSAVMEFKELNKPNDGYPIVHKDR